MNLTVRYDMTAAAPILSLAIVASSAAPLLRLDADLQVIPASASFCHVFQIDPGAVEGCSITETPAAEPGAFSKPVQRAI